MKAVFLLFLIIICQFELFISKLERKWFFLVSRRNHELVLDSRTREGCVGDKIIYRKRNNNSLSQLWRYTHRNGNLINRRHRYALQLTRTNNSQGLVLNCHQPCNPFQKFGMHLIRKVVQVFTLQPGYDYILAENRECQTAQLTNERGRMTPAGRRASGNARSGCSPFQLQLLYVPSPCFNEKSLNKIRPEKCIPVTSIYNISWTTTQSTTETTSQSTTETTSQSPTPTSKHSTTTQTTTPTTSKTTIHTTSHTTPDATSKTTKHTTSHTTQNDANETDLFHARRLHSNLL